ncbi:bifunctional precorrin-2 dehydrogenase/sirohydrochlorin ferrochelatase [Chloroflexota bacterium]
MGEGDKRQHSYYPICLDVYGKRCVVVGGGTVALRKVKALLEHGAILEVVSPYRCPELNELAKANIIEGHLKEYEPQDINDAFLVIAATNEEATNKEVADEARRHKILVNTVGKPESSDFIVPSYLRRGALTIAISTNGASPALSRKVRTNLEQSFSEEYACLTDLIEEVRSELRKRAINISGDGWQKALDLDLLIELLQSGQRDEAKAILMRNLEAVGGVSS